MVTFSPYSLCKLACLSVCLSVSLSACLSVSLSVIPFGKSKSAWSSFSTGHASILATGRNFSHLTQKVYQYQYQFRRRSELMSD